MSSLSNPPPTSLATSCGWAKEWSEAFPLYYWQQEESAEEEKQQQQDVPEEASSSIITFSFTDIFEGIFQHDSAAFTEASRSLTGDSVSAIPWCYVKGRHNPNPRSVSATTGVSTRGAVGSESRSNEVSHSSREACGLTETKYGWGEISPITVHDCIKEMQQMEVVRRQKKAKNDQVLSFLAGAEDKRGENHPFPSFLTRNDDREGLKEAVLDLGCGGGRVLFAAAMTYPHFGTAYGVEIVPGLIDEAYVNLSLWKSQDLSFDESDEKEKAAQTDFQFVCGDFANVNLPPVEEISLVLCHATLFDNDTMATVQIIAENCLVSLSSLPSFYFYIFFSLCFTLLPACAALLSFFVLFNLSAAQS
jgi:SAM-dependent methyltransferase